MSSLSVIVLIIILVFVIILLFFIAYRGEDNSSSPSSNSVPSGGVGSLTSACFQDNNCASGNCSLGFCQPVGETTRQEGASCVSNNPSATVPGCATGLICNIPSNVTIGTCQIPS